MQDFTYHSHNFSQGITDGKNTCDEMLSRAEEIGFSEIGVSNHFIYHPNIPHDHAMYFNDFDKALDYAKRDIEQTREAASRHKIKVYAGFEVDFFPSKRWRNAFEKMLKEVKPDYVIGSTHCGFNKDETIFRNVWLLGKENKKDEVTKECLRNYWQNIIDCINSGYFAFIAHFDLAANLGVCVESEWDEWKWKVVEAFKHTKTPFEINTNGIRRCGIPSPDWQIVEELVKSGVPTLLSDDAHSTGCLGQYFAEAESKLTEFGCKKRFKL